MRDFGFQWHLTDRCNLRCTHCYQDDFSPQRELSCDTLTGIADTIFSALARRTLLVNLTGGEPFLFPGLLHVIEHLNRHPNLAEVNVITNGTIAKAELLEEIARLSKVKYLKVSLESAIPAINDRIRGAGNLARVRGNLPEFRNRSGKPLILMMTLAQYNVASLRRTVEFARNEGFAGVILERFVPLGTGSELASAVLDRSAWERAAATLIELSGLEASPVDLLPYRAYWLWTDGAHADPLSGATCNLGDGSMALMPNADVYPCRRFPHRVGNALNDPFDQILARLGAFAPEKMRSQLDGSLCTSCNELGCTGCRALALALTGQLGADDPQCALGCAPHGAASRR